MLVDIEFPRVTAVRHVRDYVLWLHFSDGVEGEVDLANELHGPGLAPLRDVDAFRRVRLARPLTIEWPNGADFAHETLYDLLQPTGRVAKRSYRELFDAAEKALVAHSRAVPEISRFFGIVISMMWNEHEAPHFHARYGEYAASIDIRTGHASTYGFPPAAMRRILTWHGLHKAELLANWERMRRQQKPLPIEPLRRS